MSEWYLTRHQRQEEEQQQPGVEEALKIRQIIPSSHVHNRESPTNNCTLAPMSVNQVKELTWEDVVTAMQTTTKPTTWYKDSGDTLESIVHQVTRSRSSSGKCGRSRTAAADEAEAWVEEGHMHDQMAPKRLRSEDSDHCGRYYFSTANYGNQDNNNNPKEEVEGTATFCTDHDATMMSWPSSESLRSVKTKTSTGDDLSHSYHGAAEENRNEENETKLTRSSRAAASHNHAERRRRSRINQKMKDLQKLVPNASKTDKASMLDEIIGYLKQLQAQVKMMNARNMSQMMLPLGMHPQLQQMSLMARMGINTGLGMAMGTTVFDMNNIARSAQHQTLQPLINSATMAGAAPMFLQPPFVVPPAIPSCTASRSSVGATANNPVPCNDPYTAFLAHSMNIEMYNKMAALFRHQAYQSQ